MATLNVTKAELQYLVDYLGADFHWPQRSHPLGAEMISFIPVDKREDPGGGPSLRLRVLALFMYGRRNQFRWPTMPLEVTLQEVWLLEQMVWHVNGDIRVVKFEDGQPILTFAIKVWDLLIQEHGDQLPEHLRIYPEEAADARHRNTASADDSAPRSAALDEADAAIAAIEAALAGSRASQGTGPDLSTAAA